MIDYSALWTLLEKTPLHVLQQKAQEIETRLSPSFHGDIPRWRQALASLPDLTDLEINLNADVVTVNSLINAEQRNFLRAQLMQLHPWRKGPFNILGLPIDTEWRSDWKWQRVKPHIKSLQDKTVLDVGCGSGYHCWRMAGEGARLALGIDPSLIFVMQYWVLQHFMQSQHVWVLPLALEDLPVVKAFDTVFSMGILYHRRAPLDHLLLLKDYIKPGGELVLETLVEHLPC